MNSLTPCLAACLFGVCAWAMDPMVTAAAPVPSSRVVVLLKDKSQVVGEIIGLRDGVCQVQTESLGIVRIPQNTIASIVFDRSALPPADTVATRMPTTAATGAGAIPEVGPLLKSIAANPDLMGKIENLKEDTAIQAVVNDPAIMKAAASGDFRALLDNEKVKALMDNPQIQALTRDVLDAQPAAPLPKAPKRATPTAKVPAAP